ncbi:response regulator [Flavobacterium silvisoli]|uniref:Response regulator n=1 Tax=Flavobacterium silvisoli TaxID=2529433 RepID=A0A4Q9YV59_9FLAO|nr:response regulator [Flavobacterium silvisoli]TBX67516.1 response regulator [Flavobacterium silvisoli]
MKTTHILLIDDNDIDNFITHHVISKAEIAEKITVKNSAIEALEYLRTIRDDFEQFPDLIFLDVAMPLMDGFGFLNEIIKFPKLIENQCFVAMLTSSNNKDDIERAMQYSVVKKYFNKPLKIEMLADIR